MTTIEENNLISRDSEWREELRKRFTTKERTAVPRVKDRKSTRLNSSHMA